MISDNDNEKKKKKKKDNCKIYSLLDSIFPLLQHYLFYFFFFFTCSSLKISSPDCFMKL